MHKALKIALPILGGTVAAAAATVFLVAPGRASEEKKSPFFGRNFAHRGLHKIDRTIPENSLPAFNEAAENGYGVELDARLTADGRVVVFHDDDLERACGVEGRVEDTDWEELKKLHLFDTHETIPLLGEALAIIGGRVPVIIELKQGRNNAELCERTMELIRCYNGDVCVESFNPFILRWFKKHAPGLLRGQLTASVDGFGEGVCKAKAFAVSNLLTNFLSRPQFIAHSLGRKSFLARLCEKMGAMKVAWTSRDWTNEDDNDAVIFEFYRPRVKYK